MTHKSILLVLVGAVACSASEPMSGEGSFGLVVDSPTARSCELLLNQGSGTLSNISWPNSVVGTHRNQGHRSAIAFFSREDSSLAGRPITLSIEKASSEEIQIIRSRCFDRLGAVVPNATVRLGDHNDA